jgi:hypothetical protein
MRSMIIALAAAFAIGTLAMPADRAVAAKSKKGCEVGKEIWNAVEGKCVPGKYAKKSAKKTAKTPAKK